MVSWTEFEKLTGSAQHNFEFLCRALIRLQYGRHGQFAALANQPGVEFHLYLRENCPLGSQGRWYGWQCRWYDLPSGKALGNTRRKKIEESLAKTAKALPALTDWILWTRHPLTKADQKWFYALETNMQIALWTAAEAETLLSGDAEILRRTYFGELLFTPASLAALHDVSVAPIRKRWLPEVHQTVDAERTLRRMLGEAESWEQLTDVARRLLAAVGVVDKEPLALAALLSTLTPAFTKAARELAATLQDVHRLLENGDLELLRLRLDAQPRSVSIDTAAAPRRMRGARLACGLVATNALADLKLGLELLDNVDGFLGTRLVGVLADAGGGKTQLAAELTAPLKDRPAGIYLRGSELHSGRTLDDLARSITIQGNPVPSMEALLAALDATGQRARRRLPLVIDGLNEAENPMDWKPPLSSINALLPRFANVLIICTVRTGARRPTDHEWPPQQREETLARIDFARQALPDDVRQIEIPDFGGDTVQAIQKYFRHFLISPGDEELPFELLSHPLTLRIFCEVTNPERKREVGIEAMPGSLTGLFERYLDLATERIGELAPRNHRYYDHDIRGVLDHIGTALWEDRSRELPEEELRKAIRDDTRPWNESIIHMLEQEGVLLLIPGQSPGKKNVIAVYDALGGYLIANAILAKHGRSSLEPWLKDQATLAALDGKLADCHPLALDIFRSLVGLLPRRLHRQQLWQILDEPLRTVALRMAATLEGSYLDAATVTAIAAHVRRAESGSERLFIRLLRTRGAVGHPLNADFFDAVLRSMSVGERDLHWTEWIRRNHVEKWGRERRIDIMEDVRQLEERWKSNLTARTLTERLRAKWLMWLLTTTVRNLRDRVTRALYWFGRGDPGALFELAEGATDINDPYVFERLLAATYGAAMVAHCDSRQPDFRKKTLPERARRIFDLMFKRSAPGRTTHVLTREYARRFLELAQLHNRKLFSSEELTRIRSPHSDGGCIAWQEIKPGEEDVHGTESPFRMDFANYTLGRLAEGRGNYDFNHAGYRKVRAQVLWRVQQLGWMAEKHGLIDSSIESERYRFRSASDEHHKVDRYGKKYSWIAFFELEGWLQDQGLLSSEEKDYGRTLDVDIDPSFPSSTPEHNLVTSDLLASPRASLDYWIKSGPTPDLTAYLRQSAILDDAGPWVMLDGYVAQEDESRGRRMFAFVRSFLVAKSDAKALAAFLTKQPLGGRWLPEKPREICAFAGEVPWCDTFPKIRPVKLKFLVREWKQNVRRKRPFFSLDGVPIKLSPMDQSQLGVFPETWTNEAGSTLLAAEDLARVVRRDRVVDVVEKQKEYREIRALIPVHDLDWQGRSVDGVPIHGRTLAKALAQSAGLVHLPETHDLKTRGGVRATYGTVFRRNDYNNHEQFFFIREDILKTLLRKHRIALVWAVWGERQLAFKKLERLRNAQNPERVLHANFQAVYRF